MQYVIETMHGGPRSVRPRPPGVELLHNMMALSQYTFVLAGAMDVGTLAAFIVIFLGLGLTSTRLSWGGNTIYTKSRFRRFWYFPLTGADDPLMLSCGLVRHAISNCPR
jgi:hypothetical protein